jgi:hypothetical protein
MLTSALVATHSVIQDDRAKQLPALRPDSTNVTSSSQTRDKLVSNSKRLELVASLSQICQRQVRGIPKRNIRLFSHHEPIIESIIC